MKTIASLALSALLLPTGLVAGGLDTHAEVEVLPGWRMADGTHMAALRIVLDDGWKTYWRAPGEAGIPPVLDWSGSENLAEVALQWPLPEVFVSNGLTTLGFSKELILPMRVTAQDPGADVALSAHLLFGICEEVCMPLTKDVAGVLAVGAAGEDPRIVGALAAQPLSASEASVGEVQCNAEEIADGMRLHVRIDLPEVGDTEHLVVEAGDPMIWVSEPMVRREGAYLVAEADMVPPSARPFDVETEALRLTVLGEGRGVDIRGCAARQ